MIASRHYPILLFLFSVGIGCSHSGAGVENRADTTQVFIVRHAETAPDGTRDPGLSASGQARAARLASLVADTGLAAVIATEYRRTQETAAAAITGTGLSLEVVPYGTGPPDAYAERLVARIRSVAPGRSLLVTGHSNTVPVLVQALTGRSVSIAEDEYDRLFVVTIEPDGEVSLQEQRY